MKNLKKLLSLTLLSLSIVSLTSCNKSSVKLEENDVIFSKSVYVDLSNIPEKLQFNIELEAEPIEINLGARIKIYEENFQYKNNIISIDTNVFKDEAGRLKVLSGEQSLKIRLDNNKSVSKDILLVDKVIKTASDLQSINNKPQGSYILGNDIDCSSISNFEPLGFMESDTRADQEFLGVFDGNGYALRNITSKYSTDLTNNERNYNGQTLFEDESHRNGDVWGVFQTIGSSGVVRNLSLDNCNVAGRTIVGVLCGNNAGTIENVFINSNCHADMSTHFYDDNCNVGGIAGINGGTIKNVVSLATTSIVSTYLDYGDNYLEEEGVNYHYFYGGTKGWKDSNGLDSTGVYAGIGKSWGLALDCYALKFETADGTVAPFGQTHLYENKNEDGPNKGELKRCEIKTKDEMKNISLYSNYSKDSWNIYDNSLPTLKAIYPTYKYTK